MGSFVPSGMTRWLVCMSWSPLRTIQLHLNCIWILHIAPFAYRVINYYAGTAILGWAVGWAYVIAFNSMQPLIHTHSPESILLLIYVQVFPWMLTLNSGRKLAWLPAMRCLAWLFCLSSFKTQCSSLLRDVVISRTKIWTWIKKTYSPLSHHCIGNAATHLTSTSKWYSGNHAGC